MNYQGERKAALLLASLHRRDRGRIMAALPVATARRLALLVRQVEPLALPLEEVMSELEGDAGASAVSSPESPSLMEMGLLAKRLPAEWFARVSLIWGIDKTFLLELLEPDYARAVERAWPASPTLPNRVARSLKYAVSEYLSRLEVNG
ncbi:hypothetical protein EBB59_02555 [Lysobacter pythonis]|uniref:Uncharacterized protein n=1 Tax=Solilutibacter pythonis TaxID=2483112 RepID=A0A3M2I1M8_9GAMM|nr:hypothetical protein [Lysobacter pythonis]RMH94063.1 hypothetical protein EBB59_02555 [Lysobacter pythonis]